MNMILLPVPVAAERMGVSNKTVYRLFNRGVLRKVKIGRSTRVSEQELNDMNAFYSSGTGRKVIERLPVLVQKRNQLASMRLQENIGELRYEIDARTEKAK